MSDEIGDDSVGASIGVAVSNDGDDVSPILRRADAAMYRVKSIVRSTDLVSDSR